METTQTSQSLYQALWNSADVLRSKMDANDYKSYLLGMVFYKYFVGQDALFCGRDHGGGDRKLGRGTGSLSVKYYEDEETQGPLDSYH